MTEPILVESEPQTRSRVLVFGGAGAALLVVAFLLSSVLSGDGDSGELGDGVPSPSESGGPAQPVPDPPAVGDVETFEIFSTKNPFQPQIAGPIGSGTTPTTSGRPGGVVPTTVPGGVVPTTVPGGTTPTTVGGTVPGATTTTTGSLDPQPDQRISLEEMFDDNGARRAVVRVNDTVYTVTAGENFAGSYRAVSLGESCGQFLFGDSPFELCIGEEILK